MKDLTKAEEQVMQYLWKLEKAFLKDVVDSFPEPRPASTTVSTVIRTLVDKGVVGFKRYGPANQYYPLVSRQEYSGAYFKKLLRNYFSNSYKTFASFFTKDTELSLTELEELKEMVEKQIEEKRKQEHS